MVVRRIQNDELYHHGVKGQRWGHRKQRELIGRRRSSRPIQSSTTSFASKRQRSGVQRFSDTMSKKRTLKIVGGVVGGLVAANLAMYGLGYIESHGSKIKHVRMDSSEAKRKAQMAKEWYDSIKNGASNFNNSSSNFRDSFRRNLYALPKY